MAEKQKRIMDELFDLENFRKYKEDNRREVKSALNGLPLSLWETYSAFANSYGGIIILGVIENNDGSWSTSGLKSVDKIKKDFWNTINNDTKVSINLLVDRDVQTYELNGDFILVINVPMAKREQKPVYINNNLFNGTYKRNGDGDFHCSKSQIKEMLRDQDDFSDAEMVDYMGLDSLCEETIKNYRSRQEALKPTLPWKSLENDKYLEMIGAAKMDKDGKYHPTKAGLLMFGYEYKIDYEFPEFFLDYRENSDFDKDVRWTDRIQSQSGDWPGNLYEFYFRAYNKIVKNLKVPFKLVGIDRIEDTPAHQAVREALANALIHADYKESRGIVILANDEEIIFRNPGSIRVGKYQMLKGGQSDPRNQTLMKMFNLVDIGEKAGSGMPKIIKAWEETGYNDPSIKEDVSISRTILTLPLTHRKIIASEIKFDKDAPIKNKVKEIIKHNNSVSMTEMSEFLKITKRSVARALKDLKESGEIVRVGNAKTGHWEIIK